MASGSKSDSDFGWVLITLVVLFALWLAKDTTQELTTSIGPIFPPSGVETTGQSEISQNKSQKDSGYENKSNEVIQQTTQSQYQNQITLGLGNVRSATEANQEYLVISANRRNKEPVNISGWLLKNDSGRISYDYAGKAVKRRTLSLHLPKTGIARFNPFGANPGQEGPIILYPGEKAIVLSGKVPATGNAVIKNNFKVNKCFGYVQDQTSYKFVPAFSNKCPQDDDLPSSEYLSLSCLKYLSRRSSCHQPVFSDDSKYGVCADRYCDLDSSCLAFIKKNYNYEACFNIHFYDEDFLEGEWRLFLNQVWELWPNKNETIYLYDTAGKLVDQLSY